MKKDFKNVLFSSGAVLLSLTIGAHVYQTKIEAGGLFQKKERLEDLEDKVLQVNSVPKIQTLVRKPQTQVSNRVASKTKVTRTSSAS